MYPITNHFPSECEFSILKLHFIADHNDRFSNLSGVSTVVAEVSQFITKGAVQVPAFIELLGKVKEHDKNGQINWVNTGKVLEYQLEQKQYKASFIASTLDKFYAIVGYPESVSNQEV
jgi:hypothetical protein